MPGRNTVIRGLQPGFINVIAETAMRVINAKMQSTRNIFAVWDYAEALDSLIGILPPEAKKDITDKLGVDVDIVIEEALANCRADPLAHPYVNNARCLKQVKKDLDKLFRIVFEVAHRRGLFVIEKEVFSGREA